MRQIVDYDVVEFEKVAALLSSGWQPWGNFQISPAGYKWQAVVRYAPEPQQCGVGW